MCLTDRGVRHTAEYVTTKGFYTYICIVCNNNHIMASGKIGWLIEICTCGLFGIGTDELRDSDRKDRTYTDCLHFIWYFRNKIEGVSLTRLARIYGRTPRNISLAIAKIASGVRTQDYYICRKKAIMEDMIKGTFSDIADKSPTEKKGNEKER